MGKAGAAGRVGLPEEGENCDPARSKRDAMNVNDVVAEKIAAARARAEATKRRRAALAAARQRGLGFRHAAKLRRQASVGQTDGSAEDSPSSATTTEENS